MASDLGAIAALFADSKVRAYLGGALPTGQAQSRASEVVSGGNSYPAWVVSARSGGEFIGLISYGTHHDGQDLEISYQLLPQWWGRGLATEVVRAVVAHGFRELGLSCIVAETQVTNVASCALLQRVGFAPSRHLQRFSAPQVVYAISRAQHAA